MGHLLSLIWGMTTGVLVIILYLYISYKYRQYKMKKLIEYHLNSGKIIGLSLSACVRDIMLGYIKPNDFAVIISGTNFNTEESWEEGMATYQKHAWEKNPQLGRQIAEELRAEGKIIQPRSVGLDPINVSAGYWYLNGSQTKSIHMFI